MFDLVRNNRRIVQLFLALITLPFAFFGVEYYVRNAAAGIEVASVGGNKISPAEFQNELQRQQDQLRQTYGAAATPELLDTPEVRKHVLEELIDQHLLAAHADQLGVRVSDDYMIYVLSSEPALQENGKFSRAKFDALAAQANMSSNAFTDVLRRKIAMQEVATPVFNGAIPGQTATQRWLGAMFETREIAESLVAPEQFAATVKLAPDAAKNYYDANVQKFAVPEQLRAEYLVLSQAVLAQQMSVSDDEIKEWYKAHADQQYKQPEQRRASHILIAVAKDAPEAAVKAAQAKAALLLAQVRKNPADFAKLAEQNSQDPGSAKKGGDLDWFGRGSMVKPFEQAVFALKEGEIGDLVHSDFGFHIIKLTGIRPERVRPLEEVSAEIATDLKSEAAAKKYAELADAFTNTVYEQADSLQPAADKFKLKIEQSDWLTKGQPAKPPLANAKLLNALFSDDAVKAKHNTEAVEVAPGSLVAARVAEFRPAVTRPFAEVKADIEKILIHDEAVKLAQKDGADKLAKLAKGEAIALSWGPVRDVQRLDAKGLFADAAKAIFKADARTLPAYAGAAAQDGSYALYRISQVKASAVETDQRASAMREQYGRVIGAEETSAWLAALRKLYPVEINKSVLEAKEH